MKKILFFLIFSFATFFAFSNEIVATTRDTVLSYNDMVDIFLETINSAKSYQYPFWDSKVFTSSKQQDNDWSVQTSHIYNERMDNYQVTNRYSVYLYTRNGCISYSTADNYIPEDKLFTVNGTNYFDAYSDYMNTLKRFLQDSVIWLGRYKKDYSPDEEKALYRLFGVEYLGSKQYSYRDDYSCYFGEYHFTKDITTDIFSILPCQRTYTFDEFDNPILWLILQSKELVAYWQAKTKHPYEINKLNVRKLKKLKKDGTDYIITSSTPTEYVTVINGKFIGTDNVKEVTWFYIDDLLENNCVADFNLAHFGWQFEDKLVER